ncbi:MAG: hypothetical protein QNJ94_08105 [Alphaproteobacteria bacterium]|nr:hypothetical protein [Alphaproteobacteria bacterium]
MPKCLFERAAGLFISGTRFDDLPHDPATHLQLELPAYPDRRTERWDGADGVRPATAQELADFDAAELDDQARQELDETKALRAMVMWTADKLGIPRAQARDEIKAIYKSL